MPIYFLSCTLIHIEQWYGLTELEVACLIWAIKRLQISIQSSELPTIMLTNHSAIQQIIEKTTLNTSSIDCTNCQLVIASIYLSEYNLKVYYIPRKENLISNALSQLKAPKIDSNLQCC